MKTILLLGLVASFSSLFAENPSPNDIEIINRIRAREAQKKMEEDFKKPKNPEIQKDRAVLGNKSAPIMIVAYSDFQCPYCKNGYETIEAVRKKYGSKVAFVFKHFPLPMHPQAMIAAKYFEAIAAQSTAKAYKFHNELFNHQSEISSGGEGYFASAAKKVGADVEKVKKEVDTEKVKKRIDEDMAEGQKFGVLGTPAFIVAGISLYGAYPPEAFYQVIDKRLEDLKKSGAK